MKRRVLVIGLDSASLPWVERWMQQGQLPTLSRLAAEGSVGILRSVNPPLSPAAWSSFATGLYPAKHGIFDHIYRPEDSYDVAPTNATMRAGDTVWDLLSDSGKKVGVVNVPETYPPKPVNGFLISGMDTPSDDADFSYPQELKDELDRAIGGYQVFGLRSKENLDLSLKGMKQTIPMRVNAGRYLWENYRPEFMILVFMETDVIQHKCWKYMDPAHPEFATEEAEAGRQKYGTAILDIYRLLDRELGPWIDELDENTTVILMSDHGAGPLRKFLFLNNWLLQENFMHIKGSVVPQLKYLGHRLGWVPSNAFQLASNMGLGVADMVTNRIKKKMTDQGGTTLVQRAFLSWSDVDWTRTSAYTLGGNFTGIYVNLEGREPAGIVKPGADYEALRDELATRLMEWKDPDTGQPVVEAVYRREELHQGKMAQRAPDLIFETTDSQYVGSGGHEFASNRLMARSPLFNGHHRRDGMVIMHGAPVRAGSISPHEIVDLAPTILHLLGEPVPDFMDGSVIEEALDISFMDANPIRRQQARTTRTEANDSGYSDQDEQEILDRLSDLGYI